MSRRKDDVNSSMILIIIIKIQKMKSLTIKFRIRIKKYYQCRIRN